MAATCFSVPDSNGRLALFVPHFDTHTPGNSSNRVAFNTPKIRCYRLHHEVTRAKWTRVESPSTSPPALGLWCAPLSLARPGDRAERTD